MRELILGLAMTALVMAKPELYREKEDFQYSRRSSDEGSKSGFYDAQRGNMGGNYEKAHNMDALAQHQMGGLVRQVEGELGDGSKTRSGSVFSAANSRGVYGSGRYDLSNLAGRNFEEGAFYGDSQLASNTYAAHSSSHNNARYSTSGHALNHRSDYNGLQTSNLQEAQNAYGTNQFEQGTHTVHGSRYHSQSGYEGQNLYERVNTDHTLAQNVDSNTHHRLISTVPVKIIVRPGQRIAVPIATQTHSGAHIASNYDQNAINSDAEVLNTNIHDQPFKPSNTAKHYESSYKYHKEWEKHDTKPAIVPLSIPTVAPIPKNSELYDDSYVQRGMQYSGDRYGQNNFNTDSHQSHYQSDYNARHQASASSNSQLNAYSQSGANYDVNSQAANFIGEKSSKPKSYESSYSYHKSWERQGDPYIIKPATNGVYEGQTSSKLTDASASQAAYSSYNYGARQIQNQQKYSLGNCIVECEPNHSRVVRSYDVNQDNFEQQSQNMEDLHQQSQNQWNQFEEHGQQRQGQWEQAENFGQETQNNEKLEDFGQQTQDKWVQPNNFEENPIKENLEGFDQQTQNNWEKAEKDDQQTQSRWETVGQQTQNTFDNLEDLGQQVQTKWETNNENQNQSDVTENFGQQTQTKWYTDNIGQQTENKSEQLEDLGQQSQTKWNSDNAESQTQSKLEEFGQSQIQHGQQTQDFWGTFDKNGQKNFEQFGQQSENKWHPVSTQDNKQFRTSSEKPHSYWDKLDNIESRNTDIIQEQPQHSFQSHVMTQQTSSIWAQSQNHTFNNNDEGFALNYNTFQNTPEQRKQENASSLSSLWGKLDNFDDDHIQYTTHDENIDHQSQTSISQYFNENWKQRADSHSFYSTDFHGKLLNHGGFDTKPLNTQDTGANTTTELGDAIHQIKKQENQTNFQDDRKNKSSQTLDKDSTQILNTLVKAQNTSTTLIPQGPKDIGRGDIESEKLTIDKSTTEKTNPTTNAFSVISIFNKPKNTQNGVSLTTEKNSNVDQQSSSTGNGFEHSKMYKMESGNMERVSSDLEQQKMERVFINQNIQQDFKEFEKTTSTEQTPSDINNPITTDLGKMSPKSELQKTHKTLSHQQNTQTLELFPENNDYEKNKDIQQENQQFTDLMQNFENQFTYQHSTEQLLNSNKHNHELDQQANWKVESQNADTLFVDNLSQQNEEPLLNFDEHIVDFGQEQEMLQNQKVNKNLDLVDFIPQTVNSDQYTIPEKNIGRSNDDISIIDQTPEVAVHKQHVSSDQIKDIKEQHQTEKTQAKITNSSTIEIVTENPGFWKSVGNKLSNAKNKVASWFGS